MPKSPPIWQQHLHGVSRDTSLTEAAVDIYANTATHYPDLIVARLANVLQCPEHLVTELQPHAAAVAEIFNQLNHDALLKVASGHKFGTLGELQDALSDAHGKLGATLSTTLPELNQELHPYLSDLYGRMCFRLCGNVGQALKERGATP